MLFSIIVPAHNAESFISRALNSIQEQVFADYELIVICDSCIDNTYNIAKSYTDNVHEVKYGNVGETRNFGLSIAKGEYILFLDDDDHYLHKYVLLRLDNYIKSIPTLDVLCFGFINGIHGPIPTVDSDGNIWPNVWSKLLKKTAIGDIRFKPSNFAEDLQFTNELLNKHLNIHTTDEPFVFYNYPRKGSLTNKHSEKS